MVDDFESCNDDIDAKTTIFDTWLDGWVNNTGSTVGYLNAPFAERTIVRSGVQSMPLQYDNTVSPFYSEAERRFKVAQDLTVGGANSLSPHFRGSAANSPQTLYIVPEDNTGHTATFSREELEALLPTDWQQWVIPYSYLAGVNLSQVATMYIGIGNRVNPTAGGTGIAYMDDVAFGRPATKQASQHRFRPNMFRGPCKRGTGPFHPHASPSPARWQAMSGLGQHLRLTSSRGRVASSQRRAILPFLRRWRRPRQAVPSRPTDRRPPGRPGCAGSRGRSFRRVGRRAGDR